MKVELFRGTMAGAVEKMRRLTDVMQAVDTACRCRVSGWWCAALQHCSTAALQPSYLVLDPVKLQPGLQLQAERGDGGDLQRGGC